MIGFKVTKEMTFQPGGGTDWIDGGTSEGDHDLVLVNDVYRIIR